ncbi:MULTISPECIES: acyl-CoA synthetase [unclassified Delftia]|uniref:acyl-CoA synthetase n=1 Tax=unclassified Delftia TaxID=2613839 RepID=UPI0018FF5AE1|nr:MULTISPECIES: acyl-CoA synthetase [unclassified Delftia]MBK0114054.1 acyl-CoA synthetase [Delftia sp. S65]MBK0117862.1 acyl-CoA synthetase [Delftia sp. S67]MBK0129139.1 acyl-CoA synthetase [Delftia sp. S66]
MYPGTHAASTPEKPAVIMAATGQTVTYAALEQRSLRLANWLRAQGLVPGDTIAVISDNDARVFDVYWAAQRAGLYLTAINYRLRSEEIQYILENSETKAIFVGGCASEIVQSIAGMASVPLRISFAAQIDGYQDLEGIIEGASSAKPEYEPRGGDMLYSSGTTGRPKGVRPPLPGRDIGAPGDAMVAMFGGSFGFSAQTVYLSPAPLYHAAPLRTCAAVQALGGTVVVMNKFDPEGALALIEKYRITASQWVPTMFVRLLKLPREVHERYDLRSMEIAIHAAAPCPLDVKQQMIDWWGPIVHEYYASTEVNGITVIGPQEWLRKRGSVGRPILGTIHVCDEEGGELPAGQDGLVYFEREALPFQYHLDPEKTRATQHPRHPTWTAVGDIGHVDEEGFLFLTDRKAFMIISGGVNIYPQEVENVLAMHPAVSDVAVIGVPDAEMGEQVKAVVIASPGVVSGPELELEIIAFVKSRVASFKAPRSVDFVSTLPRTATGKLVKGRLRDQYWPK